MSLPKIQSILYDLEIPSTKQAIKVRQLRARDEKILLTAKESSGTVEEKNLEILKSIKQAINNAIVTPGILVDYLAIFDIEYLFIKLRALSVSNIIEASYHDNEEMQEWQNKDNDHKGLMPEPYTFKIDLDKVSIKWPEGVEKTIEIPNSNVKILLKYPDASLYTNQEFLKSSGESLINYLIQNSLAEIQEGDERWYPEKMPLSEVMEFLNELPMTVYDKIRGFLANLPHVQYEIKYKNKFDHERTIVLATLSDFFQF